MIAAAVENVWDEDHRYHGSGSNEAGTNFILTVRGEFRPRPDTTAAGQHPHTVTRPPPGRIE